MSTFNHWSIRLTWALAGIAAVVHMIRFPLDSAWYWFIMMPLGAGFVALVAVPYFIWRDGCPWYLAHIRAITHGQ